MAGYPEPKGEICDARCDVCRDFYICGNEHMIIICSGDCKTCRRSPICRKRESCPDE